MLESEIVSGRRLISRGFELLMGDRKRPMAADTLARLDSLGCLSSTVAILSRLDRAFGSVFEP
jgi:hypothetical protein